MRRLIGSRAPGQCPASRWDDPSTVQGFARSTANLRLIQFADGQRRRLGGRPLAVDLGCGAGRNAIPLAAQGWKVIGIDLSWPMLTAAGARSRAQDSRVRQRLRIAQASMDRLPAVSRCADLIIAHGIWNLARSGQEFAHALREAARIARPGAALFVFTFSRHTLPPAVTPVSGESFIFTDFSGAPQCFLTEDQLVRELAGAGFVPDPLEPLRELNRRPSGPIAASGPVIYEGGFRRID